MRHEARRSVGTVLLAVGLLIIVSLGGYFAWTEVQAAQVQSELDASAAAAVARATRVTQPAAVSAPASVKPTLTATRKTVSPTSTPTPTPTRRPVATAASTPTAAAPVAAAPGPTSQPGVESSAAPVAPVRLVIPDLKIDTKVVEMGWTVKQTAGGPVSEWDIPANAAGHHKNSALIGEPDNLVISGHNNILGRVFMPISQAWNNDTRVKVDNFTDKSTVLDGRELVLYDAAGNVHAYVITEFYRLKDTGVSQAQRIKNGQYIQPTDDERVTIVTCWPPTNNTHRLIVIARPER